MFSNVNQLGATGLLTIDWLGGTSVALIVSLVIRLIIGIGWYRLFERVGEKGYKAFIPVYGPYKAFRMVYDDFSFAAIFGMTCFIAWVNCIVAEPNGIVMACAVANVVLWWVMALLTCRAFSVSMLIGCVYGVLPWAGALILGFGYWSEYVGAWTSDPDGAQPQTREERLAAKKARKKAAKAEKATKKK